MRCIGCGKEGIAGTCGECQIQVAIVNARIARANAPKIDDGGPAFPSAASFQRDTGMTLRDYFAGQALAGILGGRTMPLDQAQEGSEHHMSISAYIIADAMLAARRPQPKGGAL